MPNISAPALSFPTRSFPTQQSGAPTGVVGELLVSELVGKYSTLVKSQKVFYTSAIITAPASFVTATQLGPMIWNRPASGVDAHILAVAVGQPTTATSVGGAIGYASSVQAAAPTSPTAITAVNAYAGGGPSSMGAVNSGGVVSILPTPIFLPLVGVSLAATTVGLNVSATWTDIGGALIIGPGNVGYICGSAVQTAGVFTIGIMWAEIPA
jgi:hypothetical protein